MTVSIADLPTGTNWYVVNPGGIHAVQQEPCYAGPDRDQAADRLVALIAQGVDVLPGERFRPNATDAYVAVARVDRIGDHTMLGPADLDEENALLAEARAIVEALDQPAVQCDECYVHPDGTRDDGTMCVCASGLADPKKCRCQASPAEWFGPAYIRAEIAAEEV